MKPRRQPKGLSLIERAVVEKQVRETFTAAQIHAMNGDDSDAMVKKAGTMFYVVLGAAITDGLDADMPEIRILRGACNALYEQAGESVIQSERRASIKAGLQACGRLLEVLDYDSVVNEAFKLHMLLKLGGHVDWRHFESRLQAVAA